jgi:DNA-binding GntR family transcriptional regulator
MWSWFIELNREFHFTIFEAADNSVLLENIRIFWSQLDTMLASTSFHLVPNRAQEDVDEHVELVALLAGDDPDPLAIELAARRHRLRTATYLQRQSQPVVASAR